MDNIKIINPLEIQSPCLPMVVFVDDRNSWLSWKIKNHTKSTYNHVMLFHKPGIVASMNPGGYREESIEKWLKENITLKFWSICLTPDKREKILSVIDKKIKEFNKKPFGQYDYLGIVGQFIKIPWIQNPWKEFCSENVAAILRELGFNIPAHDSPGDLNKILHSIPEFKEYGYYLLD